MIEGSGQQLTLGRPRRGEDCVPFVKTHVRQRRQRECPFDHRRHLGDVRPNEIGHLPAGLERVLVSPDQEIANHDEVHVCGCNT